MLSVFPQLFDYSFLAITVLRITLGVIFIFFAYGKLFRERSMRIAFFDKLSLRPAIVFFSIVTGLELIAGIFLTIGLFTQIMAMITGTLMVLATLIKWRRPDVLPYNTAEFYILLALVSYSLVFLGPGSFAFDLPL